MINLNILDLAIICAPPNFQTKKLPLGPPQQTKGLNCIPDGIIGLYDGIGVANSAAIGGVQIGDILGSSLDLTDTAQFVLGLLVGDPKK